MYKPIIGIAGNERASTTFEGNLITYTHTNFVNAIENAGGIPLIIPISNKENIKAYVKMIDKLILTGGQNVEPSFYGEERTIDSDDFYIKRDIFEIDLIKEVMKAKKPVFSVCRGTQLINIVLGGTLHQDIENHWQQVRSDYTTQVMETKAGTILNQIYGDSSKINSFHHQSIKDLAKGLEVVAHDPEDGVIEAVQSTRDDFTFIGVQWHPELLHKTRDEDKKLFDYIVNEL